MAPACHFNEDMLKRQTNRMEEATGNGADKPRTLEGPVARTTKLIALSLLGSFVTLLAGVGAAAIFSEDPTNSWLDLFKSGFLLLGGGLTTIIGYYFGNQGVQELESRLQKTVRESESAQKEVEKQKKLIEELEKDTSPTLDEEADDIEIPTQS